MRAYTKPPIDLPTYERIFQTIHSIVKRECSDPTKSCMFFGILGAFLLAHHHGLRSARPVMGLAGYNLRTPTNFVSIYGREVAGEIVAVDEGFHCWVESDGWAIDFSAPLFGDSAPIDRLGTKVPPLMFVKPLCGGERDISGLNSPGAYLLRPDRELTSSLLKQFFRRKLHGDLANICSQWYVPPPGIMPPSLALCDSKGKVSHVKLSLLVIRGSW
jgi:hypothetical protein